MFKGGLLDRERGKKEARSLLIKRDDHFYRGIGPDHQRRLKRERLSRKLPDKKNTWARGGVVDETQTTIIRGRPGTSSGSPNNPGSPIFPPLDHSALWGGWVGLPP